VTKTFFEGHRALTVDQSLDELLGLRSDMERRSRPAAPPVQYRQSNVESPDRSREAFFIGTKEPLKSKDRNLRLLFEGRSQRVERSRYVHRETSLLNESATRT
jgi:hypothetical protein